ncbi:sensor domain-containing diguanylate cyclase [Pseudoduganella violaceinigra]|uniref:sensor domain-containing diguanylate cyclase n=1 Tax=Pseudoduganella violaceinigra TaxID=246602 RepID=UPI0004102285|nr:sensor domain-containing diguanylate cyclase [Pseudoduganella violaceinigra]
MSDRLDLSNSKLVAIMDAQLELARLGPAFGALMDCAAAKAMQLTGADGSVIELVEGSEVVYRAAQGLAEAQLGLRMQIKGSLSGQVLTARQAATCNDSEIDERVNREACRRVGLRSMAILPLLFGDQAGGVLKLAWREPRPFDQDEVAIGQSIANMTAAMMYHASQEGGNVLQRKVTQDPATGLPNRSSFYEQLRVKVDDAIARGGHVGVMVARVRSQRREVMVELAKRLARECREGDVLGRLGVDEFGMILSVAGRRSVIQSQVLRFRQAVSSEPVSLPDGEKIDPVMHVGSALYPDDGQAISELLAVARALG